MVSCRFLKLSGSEQLDFGTSLNQRFNAEVTKRLKVEDYLVKRSSVTAANLDFANRLADKLRINSFLVSFEGSEVETTATLSKYSR